MASIQFSYVDYMAMWTRLDELIVPVCREIAHTLHLDTSAVLDAAATFYGFSDHGGLQVGLGTAARANYLLEEFINHDREEALAADDSAFLKVLTEAYEQAEDISEALEAVATGEATAYTESTEVTFESPLFDALAELRENILWNFTANRESPLSPNAFGQAVEFSAYLSNGGLESERNISQATYLHAICEARHGYFFLENGAGFWDNLIETVDNPEWARHRRAAVPDLKHVLQELSSDGVTSIAKRYPDAIELRRALRYQPTEFFDMATESGPTFYLALAHAPQNARFHVQSALRGITLTDGAQDAGGLWLEVYIPCRDDLPRVLMCSSSKPDRIEAISMDEAREMGAPDLSGWYKVSWD